MSNNIEIHLKELMEYHYPNKCETCQYYIEKDEICIGNIAVSINVNKEYTCKHHKQKINDQNEGEPPF